MGRELSVQDVDNMVDTMLSNFDGGTDSYAFDGGISDMVDFQGSKKEDLSRRAFKIKVTNPNNAPYSFYLNPSLATSTIVNSQGLCISGALATKPIEALAVGHTNLTVASTTDMADFYKFLEQNPSVVACMRVASNVPDMYTSEILVETYNPFDSTVFNTEKRIMLEAYQDTKNLKDNFIEVAEGYEANPQKRVKTTVPANSVVTYTLYVGLILNPSKGLANTVKRAVGKRNR